MRGGRHDPLLSGEALQRVRRGHGQEHRCEVRGIEPLRAGSEAVVLEEGEIEADVVPDEHRIAGEGGEARDRVRHRWCSGEIIVMDPREPCDRRREVATGIDERAEPLPGLRAVRRETDPHGTDLDDAIRLRIEPRGLQVERDELLRSIADLGRAA